MLDTGNIQGLYHVQQYIDKLRAHTFKPGILLLSSYIMDLFARSI